MQLEVVGSLNTNERGIVIATMSGTASNRKSFQAKHAMWIVYGLMALFVLLTRERSLLDPNSFLRHRYSGFGWLMFMHGIPGAIALSLGVFQLSSRLRQRRLHLHRIMGRIYVGCVFVAAPLGPVVAHFAPIPTGMMISSIHATAWLLTTATALYCVRIGNIQQHREWMMRSYPFAMVFIVARVLTAIPAIERMGVMGVVASVWTTLAVACFLPSFVIEWQTLAADRRTMKIRTEVRSMATAD